ncbi:hypothetical protein H5410_020425 [Solanum commersonii]|uniref:Uncharacterized protein n=1 Tax=Solanum commersonii TaxID=4109 RepID=A0A9J5ZB53_SOLCO|nr:hypothetical protein H5410_020425 [Solanum commersonii]
MPLQIKKIKRTNAKRTAKTSNGRDQCGKKGKVLEAARLVGWRRNIGRHWRQSHFRDRGQRRQNGNGALAAGSVGKDATLGNGGNVAVVGKLGIATMGSLASLEVAVGYEQHDLW